MTDTITVRSMPAIGLGAFFASVTGYVLFDDVIHGQPFTISHLQSLAALVAAFASGLMAWPAITNRQTIVQGLMLVVLAVASTGYVVVSSGARNAEVAGNKLAEITKANGIREREEAQLARAEAMLADGQSKMAAECASGRGTRCRGVMATVEVYQAAIKGHTATLAGLPAPKVNGYAHAAKVLRSWGLNVTEEWLALNMPFVVVLISELGAIAFLHIGVGHKARPEPDWKDEDLMPAPEEDDKVLSYVKAFEAKNGRKPQIPEVQAKFPECSRSTVWRRIKAA